MASDKEAYTQWLAEKRTGEKAAYTKWLTEQRTAEMGTRVGQGMAAQGVPMMQVPEVGPENLFLSSEAGQDMLMRGLMSPESLTPDEQKQFTQARQLFPQIDEAAREQDQQRAAQEAQQESDQATKGAAGVLKAGSDVVAESTKPIADYFRKRKAETPHPVSPGRDLKTEPMTPEEYSASQAFKAGGAVEQGIWSAEYMVNDALSGTMDFLTQTLDRVVNSEKYGQSKDQAIKEVATGMADMIANVPDQVAGMAEQFFGSPNNVITKLIETAQAPATLATTGGIDRKELRKKAMNALYETPSALPFGVMMAAGFVKGGVKTMDRMTERATGLRDAAKGAEKSGIATPEEVKIVQDVADGIERAGKATRPQKSTFEPTTESYGQIEDIQQMSRGQLVIEANKLQEMNPDLAARITPDELVRMDTGQLREIVSGGRIPNEVVVGSVKPDIQSDIVSEQTGKVKLEPEKKPTDVTPAPEQVEPAKPSTEPITQEAFDAAKETAETAKSDIQNYTEQIGKLEGQQKVVRRGADKKALGDIITNWRTQLADQEKALAEAEATMARPIVKETVGAVPEIQRNRDVSPPPPVETPAGTVRSVRHTAQEVPAQPSVPEVIKTGNDMADAGRNLAHTKKAIQVAEQARDLKTITGEQRAQAEADIVTLNERLAEQQAEFDRLTDPGAAETVLNLQPEERSGGIGVVGKGPDPIKAAKAAMEKYGVDPGTPEGVAAGVKRWLTMKLGTISERLEAGFEEVGMGAEKGADAYHTLREAGEEVAILRRVAHENAVQQFGDLLLKETERIPRKPEWSDKDYQFVKGGAAKQIRDAVKKRDIELLKTIGSDIDAKMFQAVKGIKSIANDGTIEFGTMQRAGVYKEGAEIPDGLIAGEELTEGAYKGKTQYYRKITPKEARASFEGLSADAQSYVKEYVKRMQDLATEAGISQRVEGYVHSFAAPGAGKTRFGGLWNRLKKRVAPERKYRTGILAESGEEIQSLVMSEEKVAVDLGTEVIHNEAAAKLIGIAARTLKRGETIPDGWAVVEWTEGAKNFGKILEMAEPLLKERGVEIDLAEVKSAGFAMSGKRVIVPQIIAEDLGGILKARQGQTVVTPTTLALLEMGDNVAAWGVNNLLATMLLRPKTTALNFVSGEIQFSTKLLQDFYEGVFTKDMTKVKADVESYYKSLLPAARKSIQSERLGDNFFAQFEQKGAMPGYNELLAGFKAVELFQKRRTFDAVIRAKAKEIAGGDAAIEASIIKDPPREVLRDAYVEMDRVNFDYNNLPKFILGMKRSKAGRALVSFPSYMYKGTRLTMDLLNPSKANVLHSGLTSAERAARAAHLARAVTLGTVGYILTSDMQNKNDDLKNDVYGRTPVGEIDGQRIWVDVTQLPIVREAALGRRLLEGDFDYVAKYADAMYGFGPAVQAADIIRDVRDQYERDMPTSARLGKFVAQFQPYAPILQYLKRKTDPVKRRTYDVKSGFAQNFFYGYASENPAFSQMLPAKVDRSTKQPLKYKDLEVDVQFWTPFNIKLRDDDQYRAFLQGQMISLVEQITSPKTAATTKVKAQERLTKIQQKIDEIPK
jgi:hypothetical protein